MGRDWSEDKTYDVYSRVGYASVGVDVRIVDDAGVDLPWDGTSKKVLRERYKNWAPGVI